MTEQTPGPWEVHSEDLEDCHFSGKSDFGGNEVQSCKLPLCPRLQVKSFGGRSERLSHRRSARTVGSLRECAYPACLSRCDT